MFQEYDKLGEIGSFKEPVQIIESVTPTNNESLLLIILDDLRRAHFRVVRVKPDVAKSTSLAQEVPALIEFDLDLLEPLTIRFAESPLPV